MKVLLHGAFNNNFGDNLFVHLFYDHMKKVLSNEEIYFSESKKFGISDKLANEIGYQKRGVTKKADALIYFSGGYFGEKRKSIKETIGRYVVYCRISKKFKHLPIYIVSVGAGPISSGFLRRQIVDIFNRSKLAIVRDEQSAEYLKSYGVTSSIIVSTDTAQLITSEDIDRLCIDLPKEKQKKKRAFLHISQLNDQEIEKLIAALNLFLKNNDYIICFGYDGYTTNRQARHIISERIKSMLGEENSYYYEYETAKKFCSFLNEMDLIITPKLHVGIVGSSLGKSVIAFPHHQKISRYYDQIGYSNRYYDLNSLSIADIADLFEKFKDDGIEVPKVYRQMARDNLEMLNRELNELKKQNIQ